MSDSILLIIVSGIIGYLLGSVNVAIVLSRTVFRKDVRKVGSGNAGATNMARTYGLGAGAATLIGDMLKAVISAFIGMKLGGDFGMHLALFGCVMGHCFPVYYKFKGGKAVSVGFTMALCINWLAALTGGLGVFLIAALISKRVSVGSMAGCIGIPVAYAIINGFSAGLVIMIISYCFIIFMHRENIKRLINGTEPVFELKKTDKKKDDK